MSKADILRDYIEYKKTNINSERRLIDIERYIRKFINFKRKPLNKYEENDLIKFINNMKDKFTTNSINTYKALLKNFIKWYYEDYPKRFRNLEKLCRTQKAEKSYSPEEMLKEEDIKKLVSGEKELMWKIYWLVYFYGGFRPSEVCVLKWKDFSFEDDITIIKVHINKTKKTFYKSLPNDVTQLLKQWRELNQNEYVFPSPFNQAKPIGRKTPYFRVVNLSQRVLGRKIKLYSIRHSFGTKFYNDDSLKEDNVANQMGHHKSMKETYLNLNEEQLKANAKKIYAKPKELSPEKRHKLEQDFENLKKLFLLYTKKNKTQKEINELVKLGNQLTNKKVQII